MSIGEKVIMLESQEKEIRVIDQNRATNFILKYHYSKIMPRLNKYYLGVFENKELLGVITLGWGTQPLGTIKKLFPNHNLKSSDYLEIGKMCFLPSCNQSKSFGTQTISLLTKWVKENTNCLFLYTMADGIMGKCGYVYQASSMRYLGSFHTQVYLDEKTHEKMHPRSVKELLKDNAKQVGKDHLCWLTQDYCKKHDISLIVGLMFRYITPLNKKAKKILDSYPQYKNLKYPKDKDLKFKKRIDSNIYIYICQPQFNMDVQEHNYQHNKDTGYEQLDLFETGD